MPPACHVTGPSRRRGWGWVEIVSRAGIPNSEPCICFQRKQRKGPAADEDRFPPLSKFLRKGSLAFRKGLACLPPAEAIPGRGNRSTRALRKSALARAKSEGEAGLG